MSDRTLLVVAYVTAGAALGCAASAVVAALYGM